MSDQDENDDNVQSIETGDSIKVKQVLDESAIEAVRSSSIAIDF